MEIQREREREIIRGRGARDEEVLKTKLDPMIKAFMSSIAGEDGDTTRKKRDDIRRFKGKAIPTILEFARTNPLEVIPGIPTHLELLTDASDSVITSRKTTLRFGQSISPEIAQLSIAGGGAGRWRIRVVPYPDTNAGTRCDLSAVLEQSAWRLETKKACQLVVVSPPEEYKGNNPPTYMRFRVRANNEVHIQQGGGRISIDTDCGDNLMDYAKLSVNLPQKTRLLGYGHPIKGQIRLTLETDEDIDLGQIGEIAAKLHFNDGSELSTEANLVITKRQRIESSGSQSMPNYQIHYVREVTTDEDESKWDDMPEILGIDSPWNADDVGGIYIAQEDGHSRLHIYINVDNKEMLSAENKMAKRNTENTIESFRQNHRALLIYHLYLLGISDESGNLITSGVEILSADSGNRMEYNEYRNEMMRLNRTSLYATKEYLDTIKELQDAES